jgi:aspartyl-tRNA synthetase
MSFVTQEDVLNTFEAMTCKIFNGVVGHDFQQPFRRMEYSEAMRDYGIDKPVRKSRKMGREGRGVREMGRKTRVVRSLISHGQFGEFVFAVAVLPISLYTHAHFI